MTKLNYSQSKSSYLAIQTIRLKLAWMAVYTAMTKIWEYRPYRR